MYRRQWGRNFPEEDWLDWRFYQSYLELTTNPTTLPELSFVVQFRVTCRGHRKIAPAAVSKLLSRLPGTQIVHASLSDDERKDQQLRDRLRNEFALTLSNWPSTIEHLCLEYPGLPPADGDFHPLRRSEPWADPLSLALNQLTQQLVTVEIEKIMIDPNCSGRCTLTQHSPDGLGFPHSNSSTKLLRHQVSGFSRRTPAVNHIVSPRKRTTKEGGTPELRLLKTGTPTHFGASRRIS
ncbi:uncharacterized protein BO97DRAFT_452235 [Aspergillus homomorphus CBS 101889]|uniref:Uncharacterized protein n=1 Tax=Aspergillus homomorphus (strain CBS 101889) TaxID=1450537 RepID=A0A395HWY9_ASPHC|nr:hypothetical protein BO97DRAFT_452235 [Aspergillus homomorphus CBS 101889]RAL12307.1 hypothetical protein BO97DRAFT_452235 [Aspergillus homomorphus CBS 101889]